MMPKSSLLTRLATDLKLNQFVILMGWSGLYFCVAKLEHLYPKMPAFSGAVAGVAILVFFLLCVGFVLRLVFAPKSISQELSQPLGLCGSAAAAVGMVLFSSVLLGLVQRTLDPEQLSMFAPFLFRASEGIWYVGAVLELALSLAVLAMYLQMLVAQDKGLSFVAPVMFIPAVGNVLVFMSGIALGHRAWSFWQFIFGFVLWPLVSVLLVLRTRRVGSLPAQMMPSWFIAVSPPCVIGLALIAFDAPIAWAWLFWTLGACVIARLVPVFRELLGRPYSASLWALSFPLAAWVSLGLSLADSLRSEAGAPDFLSKSLSAFELGMTAVVASLLLWLSAKTFGAGRRYLRASFDQI